MHGKRIDISGVYPPILSPFNADANNSLALDKLEYNIRRWNEIGFAGQLVICNGCFENNRQTYLIYL